MVNFHVYHAGQANCMVPRIHRVEELGQVDLASHCCIRGNDEAPSLRALVNEFNEPRADGSALLSAFVCGDTVAASPGM